MEKAELIYLASKTFEKGWSFETMKYSDDLYGNEMFADEVWEFVEELKEIGHAAFREKYAAFKLYN